MATATSGHFMGINYSRIAEAVIIALLLGLFYTMVDLRDQVKSQQREQSVTNDKLATIANMKPVVDNQGVALSNHEIRISDHERRLTNVEADVKSLLVSRSRR